MAAFNLMPYSTMFLIIDRLLAVFFNVGNIRNKVQNLSIVFLIGIFCFYFLVILIPLLYPPDILNTKGELFITGFQ